MGTTRSLGAVLALVAAGCLSPEVYELDPPRGRVGEEVAIDGSFPGGVREVWFGDVPAPVLLDRSTQTRIVVTVPAGGLGQPVRVVTELGEEVVVGAFEAAGEGTETEPNDSRMQADFMRPDDVLTGSTSIGGPDFFLGWVPSAQPDRPTTTSWFRVEAWSDDPLVEVRPLRVALLDSSGTVLHEEVGLDVTLWISDLGGRRPLLRVRAEEGTPVWIAAGYRVTFSATSPEDAWEPNDSLAEAARVELSNRENHARWTMVEMAGAPAHSRPELADDFYVFRAEPGFTQFNLQQGISARDHEALAVELYDASGNLLATASTQGHGRDVLHAPEGGVEAGDYVLAIRNDRVAWGVGDPPERALGTAKLFLMVQR